MENGKALDFDDRIAAVDEDEAGKISDEGAAERVYLGADSPLDLDGASAVRRRTPANLIATIGPYDAGKTCLIAAMYDAFQYDWFGAYAFAGSQTLTAFEQICHLARGASQAGDPSNPRTRLSEHPFFYHLSISERSGRGVNDLLLADRSGEIYSAISAKPAVAETCLELRRAGLLNVLVDGLKLCNRFESAAAIAACQQMVFALSESGVVPASLRVNLVLTKFDEVEASENKESALTAFEDLAGRIVDQCGSAFAEVSRFEVAARPKKMVLEERYGLEALLQSWLYFPEPERTFVARPVTPSRAFGVSVMPDGGAS